MRRFVVTSEGISRLGLAAVCEKFANDLWVPAHLTEDQAVAFALDQFRRTLAGELEMLNVTVAQSPKP